MISPSPPRGPDDEQDVMTALDIAYHGFVLDQGRIAKYGSAAELASDKSIRAAYLGQ